MVKLGMWFVYILLCDNNCLYTGISNDVVKRFLTHQNGKGSKYTKINKPLKIIYTEQYPNRSSATKREYEIKSWDREKKINLIQLPQSE